MVHYRCYYRSAKERHKILPERELLSEISRESICPASAYIERAAELPLRLLEIQNQRLPTSL
jgi:hypothetical protein